MLIKMDCEFHQSPSSFSNGIFILNITFIFIYFLILTLLFGCIGSKLWQTGSLAVAWELSVVSCMWDLFP